MKVNFHSEVEGRDWWKVCLLWWLFHGFLLAVTRCLPWHWHWHWHYPDGYYLFSAVGGRVLLTLALLVVFHILFTYFCGAVLPKIRLGNRAFGFESEKSVGMKMIFSGSLLSVVTLGVYFPWFHRNFVDYIANSTSLGSGNFRFRGKPAKLLCIFLLTFLAFAVYFIITVFIRGNFRRRYHVSPEFLIPFCLIIFLLCIIAVYFYYKWFVDFSWQESVIQLKTRFWPSIGHILSQTLLSIITVGIYAPAAFLRLWKYFTERSVIRREGKIIGHLGFEGAMGEGFGLILGQGVLIIITLGLYIPWGFARIWKWLAESTFVEIEGGEAVGEEGLQGTESASIEGSEGT